MSGSYMNSKMGDAAERMYEEEEDVVGIGMYFAIGIAICTVVVMYGWMGYTLYMGLKEERERKKA